MYLCTDLDESEYDESEEEEEDKNRAKKKRKKNRFNFIVDEAEVDDEVEDDEEWEEDAQEIGIIKNEIDELGPTARQIEGYRRNSNVWE
jgi:transcription elongation factor SPT5